MWRIYCELVARRGGDEADLSWERYGREFAGRSEETILRALVPADEIESTLEWRVARYLELASDGSTIPLRAHAAVVSAARLVPVAVVSSAFRREIEPILRGAGLDGHVRFVVGAEDVERAKPDPAPYLLALDRLGLADRPGAAVAIEDTEAGVASARAAGLHVVAVDGTMPRERLAAAHEHAAHVDRALVERLLQP